jgi:hypothetical protein
VASASDAPSWLLCAASGSLSETAGKAMKEKPWFVAFVAAESGART